jgi:hypothetical protein
MAASIKERRKNSNNNNNNNNPKSKEEADEHFVASSSTGSEDGGTSPRESRSGIFGKKQTKVKSPRFVRHRKGSLSLTSATKLSPTKGSSKNLNRHQEL